MSSQPFSSSPASRWEEESSSDEVPRHSRTPPRMKATFSPSITRNPQNSIWKVNDDPQKLDNVLNTFLGKGGDRLLPEELKWLAVTHKSFDQGRRGFNDRLAFLGRQIAIFEATQSIITSQDTFQAPENDIYAGRREPFEEPALRLVDNLSVTHPDNLLTKENMQKLAVNTGLSEVMRWKPRNTSSLKSSGIQAVMSGTVYAIIGAVALQHGGKVASRIFRERVLKKLRM
ncbi:ribonuclease-III-like-domain-containing protein [Pseudomassariella vexata]|uniref:Ribonuclease-III-like-domain-containing protein n=1 Tax=Pseudomassariella vexata TaxID=1141098 RepID=A0A1Y2EIN5_9PEZI|nr:ribonuclease-III-like-domain-containing protein [Pseudomassariella vexata]ORY71441.1 ribonuclease-III-like-domain-containing protein [Pseudomassariella vexata]